MIRHLVELGYEDFMAEHRNQGFKKGSTLDRSLCSCSR